jgi:hypothetical protein
MPLAFESISHGTIAFGFFNIDSDMLLLDRYFFFSTQFCRHIEKLAMQNPLGAFTSSWQGYVISDSARIGDLMGAIHKIRYTGFIGDVYRRFPFPKNDIDFKQKPEGDQTHDLMTAMIQKYGTPVDTPLVFDPSTEQMAIGPYQFTLAQFNALIRYVWLGGYPRWRDDSPPAYVIRMKAAINNSPHHLLRNPELAD